jgi:hypothetical protein
MEEGDSDMELWGICDGCGHPLGKNSLWMWTSKEKGVMRFLCEDCVTDDQIRLANRTRGKER